MIYKKWVYLSVRPVPQISSISIGLSANKMELQGKQIKDKFKSRIFIFLSKTPKLFEMFYVVFLLSFYFWLYYLVPSGNSVRCCYDRYRCLWCSRILTWCVNWDEVQNNLAYQHFRLVQWMLCTFLSSLFSSKDTVVSPVYWISAGKTLGADVMTCYYFGLINSTI